jgi:threonine aldolase
MAARLEEAIRKMPEVKMMFPRQANAVFLKLPAKAINGLWKRGWFFYTFIGQGGCRLMCAWDTTAADVDAFVTDLKSLL